MKKRKKVLLILSVIIIVLGISGYAAYQVLVNYVFRSVMETEINQMLDEGDITLEQLIPQNDISQDGAQKDTQKAQEDKSNLEGSSNSEKSNTQNKSKTAERKKVVKEKAVQIEKMTTQEQRAAILKLIKSRLSSADIKYLMGLLNGGLTPTERSAAKKLALQRFSQEEIKMIRDYYYKFSGMIQ